MYSSRVPRELREAQPEQRPWAENTIVSDNSGDREATEWIKMDQEDYKYRGPGENDAWANQSSDSILGSNSKIFQSTKIELMILSNESRITRLKIDSHLLVLTTKSKELLKLCHKKFSPAHNFGSKQIAQSKEGESNEVNTRDLKLRTQAKIFGCFGA